MYYILNNQVKSDHSSTEADKACQLVAQVRNIWCFTVIVDSNDRVRIVYNSRCVAWYADKQQICKN